jgi:hypothetical protein
MCFLQHMTGTAPADSNTCSRQRVLQGKGKQCTATGPLPACQLHRPQQLLTVRHTAECLLPLEQHCHWCPTFVPAAPASAVVESKTYNHCLLPLNQHCRWRPTCVPAAPASATVYNTTQSTQCVRPLAPYLRASCTGLSSCFASLLPWPPLLVNCCRAGLRCCRCKHKTQGATSACGSITRKAPCQHAERNQLGCELSCWSTVPWFGGCCCLAQLRCSYCKHHTTANHMQHHCGWQEAVSLLAGASVLALKVPQRAACLCSAGVQLQAS